MTPRELLRLAFGLIAAVILLVAGWAMAGIGSVAGNTIDGQFYQAVGWASTGLGMFAAAATLPGSHPSDYPRTAKSHKRCPECRETMRRDATRCPHCASSPAESQPEAAA